MSPSLWSAGLDRYALAAYKAQAELGTQGRSLRSITAAQAFVDEVCDGRTWRRWQVPVKVRVVGKPTADAVRLGPQERGLGGEAFVGKIDKEMCALIYLVAPEGRRTVVALHELAHCARAGGGHGPEFARAFVDLTTNVMGKRWGEQLTERLRANGLRLASRAATERDITENWALRSSIAQEGPIRLPEPTWGDAFDLALRRARRERRYTYTDLCSTVAEVTYLRPTHITQLRRARSAPENPLLRGAAFLALRALGYDADEVERAFGLAPHNCGLVMRDGRLVPHVIRGQLPLFSLD